MKIQPTIYLVFSLILFLFSSCEDLLPSYFSIEDLTNKVTIDNTFASKVKSRQAEITCEVSAQKGIPNHGFLWSTTPNPDFSDNFVELGITNWDDFSFLLIDLQPLTTYYIKSYVIVNTDTIYGKEISITTHDEVLDMNGHAYSTLLLNGKTWTKENLNYPVSGSYCYDNKSDRCKDYGRLYKWNAAKEACASLGADWRLPTDSEWKDLARSYGGYETYGEGGDFGDARDAYANLIDGGPSGFDALLGGRRFKSGDYDNIRDLGYYWTGTRQNGEVWIFYFSEGYSTNDRLIRSQADPGNEISFSCRCIKG